jgi:Flp pilus assembly protein TadB
MSSNIPLKLALKNLPDVCRYSKFKDAMTDLYLEYQLTGFSLTKTLKKLKEKFPYTEMLMFASAIEQQARGGNSESAYSNLLQVLKEKNIEYIESATESKTALLVIGVFLILINLLVIGCYPVIIEVSENLHTLMR